MTLFQDETGPLIRYASGILHIESLNPHVETHWCMSRWEMLSLGFWSLWAALK